MQPIRFPQVNRILSKPDDMQEDECDPLPVVSDGIVCISLWKGGWKERLSFLFFGKMWVWVYSGDTQAPITLYATRDIFTLKS